MSNIPEEQQVDPGGTPPDQGTNENDGGVADEDDADESNL